MIAMAWSYERLWMLLIRKRIKKSQLVDIADITTNTLARMSKDEEISMKSLGRLCETLDCKVEDMIEWIPEKKEKTE